MAKSINREVVVQEGGRIELTIPDLPPGVTADVTVRVMSAEERRAFAEELAKLLKATQDSVAHLGITEEDIEREIEAYRRERDCGS